MYMRLCLLMISMSIICNSLIVFPASASEPVLEIITEHSPFSGRLGHGVLEYNNGLLLIGGENGEGSYLNDIWQSDDGISWNPVLMNETFIARSTPAVAIFRDKIWIIGGYSNTWLNDIWFSSDGGHTWDQFTAPFPARNAAKAVVFNDRLYVIAGSTTGGNLLNDVWSTGDGFNWREETSSTTFSPRTSPAATVFHNKIWVVGGRENSGPTGNRYLSDVWSSDDGKSWYLETSSADFSGRAGHTLVQYGNKLWVIGGWDGPDYFNDIWYSDNGKTWTRFETGNQFPPRYFTSAVQFRDGLWIIGGFGYNKYLNDIWTLIDRESPSATGFGTNNSDNLFQTIIITKQVNPYSIKQGNELHIELTIFNNASTPIHDIQVLDTERPEFPISSGVNRFVFESLQPNETRIIRYSVIPKQIGIQNLGTASVMYADSTENYHIIKSGNARVCVIAPLVPEETEELKDFGTLDGFFRYITSIL